MLIPDINLLIYSYNAGSKYHIDVSSWWKAAIESNQLIGLPHLVVIGFVRLITNNKIFEKPYTLAEAFGIIDSWLARSNVELLNEPSDYILMVKTILNDAKVEAKLLTDAQIGAYALENNAVVYTNDADFSRFKKVKWLNPLTGVGN